MPTYDVEIRALFVREGDFGIVASNANEAKELAIQEFRDEFDESFLYNGYGRVKLFVKAKKQEDPDA